MKEILKGPTAMRVYSIFATAGIAAGLSFFQSLANTHGVTCVPPADPLVSFGLGASLRYLVVTVQSANIA